MAIIVLNGWELGVSESVALGASVGLSVDYVVHLSADYSHSPYNSKHDKMKQAFGHMGISILSGSITTIGSALFLLFGDISVFFKFGVLISVTIVLSFCMAMFFFGALAHLLGPEGKRGQLPYIS